MALIETSGSSFWSHSGMVGSVLHVVSRNSGSRVTRSALLMMSSVARYLLCDGVSPALQGYVTRCPLREDGPSLECVFYYARDPEAWSNSIQAGGSPHCIRRTTSFDRRRRPSGVVVSVFVDPRQQGELSILNYVGESGKTVSSHGARLE